MKELWDKALSGLGKMGINTSPMDIFNQANDIKAAGISYSPGPECKVRIWI
uniref:hypothetical protein n=1 Tax=Clostridium sp. NkU-1 TaxID=1095009 RepID=UPI0032601D93